MIYQRIISLFVSIWILFLSTGFTVYKHYCEGNFEGLSVLISTEKCEHKENSKDHHHAKLNETSCCAKTETSHITCCVNDVERFSLEEDYLLNDSHFVFPFIMLDLISFHFFGDPIVYNEKKSPNLLEFPPPLSISIEGLTQCFRL